MLHQMLMISAHWSVIGNGKGPPPVMVARAVSPNKLHRGVDYGH